MVALPLPRDVYVLQAGLVLNAFGNGAANPFMVVYLHEVRGIPLGIAGIASATSATCALLAALVSGSVADRWGARRTMIAGLLISTAGFALYPSIQEGWQAIAVAVLTGSGIGTWLTMQSALLAAIVPSSLRHLAFAQQRVAANVGLGLGAFVGGLIAATGSPETFTRLFRLNALTFVLYIAFLVALRAGRVRPQHAAAGGYGTVAGDRVFVRFLVLNFLLVAGTISLVNGLFPVFALDQGGIGESAVGVLFLLNSVLIIGAQIPTARVAEGRRRMRVFALMGMLFALCWSLVLAGGLAPTAKLAFALFVVAIVALSVGECIYDSVQGPLTAALAPEPLLGRYMAANSFSWQLGFIVGPGLGGVILGAEPFGLWALAIVVALAAAGYSLRLERFLSAEHLRTPARVRSECELPDDRRARRGAA